MLHDWTPEECARIDNLYPIYGPVKTAELMGMTVGMIRSKARKRKLTVTTKFCKREMPESVRAKLGLYDGLRDERLIK